MRLTFDRTGDVSKIEGCNTRGIAYRWSIFLDAIAGLPRGGEALDVGAGSLRESFDLAQRGFNVTSIDIDENTLSFYKSQYVWPDDTRHLTISTGNIVDSLSRIGEKKFSLVTCFDALEHLENPTAALRAISGVLADDGRLLITVPNGRTLFELAFRLDLIIARATGRVLRAGEPHLQRNSPERWRKIIADSGLTIISHDMQIGFFANTFSALVQLPLTLIGRLLRKVGFDIDGLGLSERICNGPQARSLDFIDRYTKAALSQFYGWNLFVVSK